MNGGFIGIEGAGMYAPWRNAVRNAARHSKRWEALRPRPGVLPLCVRETPDGRASDSTLVPAIRSDENNRAPRSPAGRAVGLH